jgi:predicted O-methyltransferase YrrM
MNNAIYEDPGKNINCKEFEVDKQIISKFIINELIDFVNKPYPLDELLLMVAAVCRFKPKIIIEWGTDAGTSARIFYETYKKFNINTEIHSIDLPDRNIDGMYTNIKNIKEINLYL